MRRGARWLWRHLGRRGSALVLLAAVDLIFGLFYLNPGQPEYFSASTLWLQSIAPLGVWGLIWSTVGLICLQQAFSDDDKVGFSCAVVLKVLWGLLHLGGALFADLDRGYLSATVWLVAAGWVYIISTWPEPTWPQRPPPPVVPRTDGDPPQGW